MNSRQRRTVRRAWKYNVNLGQCGWANYIDAKTWCIEHFGKSGNRWSNRYRIAIFYFGKSEDATLFALRWFENK